MMRIGLVLLAGVALAFSVAAEPRSPKARL